MYDRSTSLICFVLSFHMIAIFSPLIVKLIFCSCGNVVAIIGYVNYSVMCYSIISNYFQRLVDVMDRLLAAYVATVNNVQTPQFKTISHSIRFLPFNSIDDMPPLRQLLLEDLQLVSVSQSDDAFYSDVAYLSCHCRNIHSVTFVLIEVPLLTASLPVHVPSLPVFVFYL